MLPFPEVWAKKKATNVGEKRKIKHIDSVENDEDDENDNSYSFLDYLYAVQDKDGAVHLERFYDEDVLSARTFNESLAEDEWKTLEDLCLHSQMDDLPFLLIPTARKLRIFEKSHDKNPDGRTRLTVGFRIETRHAGHPFTEENYKCERQRRDEQASIEALHQMSTLWPDMDILLEALIPHYCGCTDVRSIVASYLVDPRFQVLGHLLSKFQPTTTHTIQNDCQCCS